jgi:phosphatidylserine decarboxylase
MYSGILAAWREVKPIFLALAGVTFLALLSRRLKLALLFSALLGWVFYFFRDPEREPASPAPDLIVAAADGKVTAIELVHEPHFFGGPARRITVFLSIIDVHVQRMPYQGQVKFLRYQAGSFAPAFLKDAEENESNLIGCLTPHGPLAVKQIAGILARRIVCWVDLDQELDKGQRLGLVKFGSRVDLLLPPEVDILVHVGQQVYGGQTIVARWHGKPTPDNEKP